MSNYFTIKAGRKKTADLVYDEQPGAEILDETRLLLEYDPNRLIYLDTVAGNDANSGFTPALAKKTYSAAAAAIGGARQTVQLENPTTITGNITVPTQCKRGVASTITPAVGALSTWANVTTPAGVRPYVLYDPDRKIFYAYALGAANMIRSIDDGLNWALYSVPAWQSYPRYNAGGKNFIGTNDYVFNGTIFGPGVIEIGDGITAPALFTIAPAAAQNSEIYRVIYAPLENCLYAIGRYKGVYRTFDLSGKTSWSTVMAADEVLYSNVEPYDIAASDVDGAVYITGIDYDGAYRGLFLSKKLSEPNFVDRSATLHNPYIDSVNGFAVACGPANPALSNATARMFFTTGIAHWAYILKDGEIIAPPLSAAGGVVFWLFFEPRFNAFAGLGNGGYSILRNSGNYAQIDFVSSGPASAVTYAASLTRIYAGRNVSPTINTPTGTPNILADVAGFTLSECQIANTVQRVASCSFVVAVISGGGAITFERCRANTIDITKNIQTISGCLLAEARVVASPVAQDDVKITRNTIVSALRIVNTAATNRELIESNIVEGGVVAAFPVTVKSGNYRGAHTNAIFNPACTFIDPHFVNLIDYKLQYASHGFIANSPMVQKSPEYLNTLGQRRDLGAWSAYETNIEYRYNRAFRFLKPSKEQVKHVKHNRADLHVSIDGTPDVAIDPAGRWEELVLSYRALPNAERHNVQNHIAFVDFMESLIDSTVSIDFDPNYTPALTVTTAAAHVAGDVVLNLNVSSLREGDVIVIDGVQYFVLYTPSNTRAVLDKPLHIGLASGVTLQVLSTSTYGDWVFIPQSERSLSRWYESATDWLSGLTLRFVRRWQQ